MMRHWRSLYFAAGLFYFLGCTTLAVVLGLRTSWDWSLSLVYLCLALHMGIALGFMLRSLRRDDDADRVPHA